MILAVDPGYRNYGVTIWKNDKLINAGCIHTVKSKKKLLRVADDDVQRIQHITRHLSKVIKDYKIKGVLGELPPAGVQNAKAAKGLGIALGLSVALFEEFNLPVEWATPGEVKKAIGKKNASKENMMSWAIQKQKGAITYNKVFIKKAKKNRLDPVYWLLDQKFTKNSFEHIADSIGVYEALKESAIGKILRR